MRILAADFGQGVSFEAFRPSAAVTTSVQDEVGQINRHLREPLGAYGEAWKLEIELAKIGQEAVEPGWDGDAAEAVSLDTLQAAHDFVEQLPAYWPIPEVSPDTEGEITFEWRSNKDNTLLVSLYADRRIGYAGLSGGTRFHGYGRLGDSIPTDVAARIETLIS